MKNILFLSLITLPFVLFSCKKGNLTDVGGSLLQSIIYKEGDSALYTSFYYDQGKLVSITDSNNNGHLWKTFVEYNSAGKLVKFKVLYRNNPNGTFEETSDSLVYNNNVVVEKLFNSYSVNPNKKINTYNYIQDKLSADTGYSYWSDDVYGYTNFTYDNNDDIIQSEVFSKDLSGVWKSNGIIAASYDSKTNPYNSIGLPAYFIKGDDFLLSKHNVTQIRYYNGTTAGYTYEYYNNGLPKKVIVNYNNGSPFIISIEFFYD